MLHDVQLKSLKSIFSFAMSLFLFAELALSFSGKQMCPFSGCRAVETLFHHTSIVAAGAFFFLAFSLASEKCRRELAKAAAFAEVVFLLRQYEVRTLCIMCMVVAISVFLLYLPYARKKDILPAIAIATAFLLTQISLPSFNSKKVLVYSPDCPHCRTAVMLCRQMSPDVSLCDLKRARVLLYCFGIKKVPALVEVSEGEKAVAKLFSKDHSEGGFCTVNGCGR